MVSDKDIVEGLPTIGQLCHIKKGKSVFVGKVAATGEISVRGGQSSYETFFFFTLGKKSDMDILAARYLAGDYTPFSIEPPAKKARRAK